jgi:hypothetical protein
MLVPPYRARSKSQKPASRGNETKVRTARRVVSGSDFVVSEAAGELYSKRATLVWPAILTTAIGLVLFTKSKPHDSSQHYEGDLRGRQQTTPDAAAGGAR